MMGCQLTSQIRVRISETAAAAATLHSLFFHAYCQKMDPPSPELTPVQTMILHLGVAAAGSMAFDMHILCDWSVSLRIC